MEEVVINIWRTMVVARRRRMKLKGRWSINEDRVGWMRGHGGAVSTATAMMEGIVGIHCRCSIESSKSGSRDERIGGNRKENF